MRIEYCAIVTVLHSEEIEKAWTFLASHAGILRGARISFLPTNPCSTENNINFLSHCFICVVSDQSAVVKLSVDRLNTTHNLVVE